MAGSTNSRPGKPEMDALKKQNGKLFSLESSDGFLIIMRSPTVNDMDIALKSRKNSKSEFALQTSILRTCAVYEDKGALNEDNRRLGFYSKVDDIIDIKEVTVKEL